MVRLYKVFMFDIGHQSPTPHPSRGGRKHEGLLGTLKRLAEWAPLKLRDKITHRVNRRDYRSHRKQAQNHISPGSREGPLGDSYDVPR